MRRLLLFAAIFACNTDTFTDDGGADSSNDSIVNGGGDGGSGGDGETKDVAVKSARFCETVDAQFCADFDIPNDAGAGFGPPTIQNGWFIGFEGTQTVDASPMAVSVTTLADAAGAAFIENPNLSQNTTTLTTRLVVDADVFLTNVGAIPDPIMVFSAGGFPSAQITFGLAMQSNTWKLVRRSGGSPMALNPQPPTNQWLHAVLAIDFDATNGTVTLDIGTSHAQMTGVTGVDAGAYPGYVSVGGSDTFYPNGGLGYFVDNVVARWQ